MQDITRMLADLRRPALLVRTARIGAAEYRREAHLPRVLGYGALPRSAEAALRLFTLEGELEAARRDARADYSPARHVEVLIALMGEARMLRAAPGVS
ncbi:MULTISPECIES: DUF6477 family protein [unclassified Rhodosalinus]|uniref:DUF6477 family protein n=1 Tax=unclassified Rhodosalinus TaxID=2630183 RepID=UPI003523FC97